MTGSEVKGTVVRPLAVRTPPVKRLIRMMLRNVQLNSSAPDCPCQSILRDVESPEGRSRDTYCGRRIMGKLQMHQRYYQL